MPHSLAHDRRQEAISRALDSDDDLMDLDSMARVARDFLDTLTRWNARNEYNPHLQIEEAPACVEHSMNEITALRERQAERVQNDAVETYREHARKRWSWWIGG